MCLDVEGGGELMGWGRGSEEDFERRTLRKFWLSCGRRASELKLFSACSFWALVATCEGGRQGRAEWVCEKASNVGVHVCECKQVWECALERS